MPRLTRRELVNRVVPGAMAGALIGPPQLEAAPGIRIVKAGAELRFLSGTTLVARIPAVAEGEARSPAEQAQFAAVAADRAGRKFQSGPWDVSDEIRQLKPGLYEWKRAWKSRASQPVQADLSMEIESGYAPEFTLIPGISYNGNAEAGVGAYGGRPVKGLLGPDGKSWIFSAFRTTVPAGNYSEGGGWSIFVFTSTERKSLFCAFSLEERNGRMAHRILWPERDNISPLYGRGGSALRGELSVAPAGEFAATIYLVLTPAARKRRAFAAGMDHAWRINRKPVKASFPPQRLWDLGTQYARESLWYDDNEPAVKFTGFCFGMSGATFGAAPGPEGFQRHATFSFGSFDIGWCNQNAAWGVVLLQDYIRSRNQDSLTKGERTLDFWAENGRLPNGLFLTEWGIKLGLERWGSHNANYLGRPAKPKEYFLDCVNLGFGAYNFLVASELAAKIGKPKPLWRKTALDACDFFVTHALPDGTFGKAWSLEGECLNPGCTTGAFILLPMLKAYRITREAKYLQSAKRAFHAYLERDLDHFVCTSGAIDADTIDRESGVPMLLAAMDLYELTGSKEYLEAAELAAYYLASWQWHYAPPLSPDSAVLKIDYEWFAGTKVDIMSTSQDPWGSLWAYVWLRLAKATGKTIWRDRAIQCFNQGTRGISDGTLVVRGARRPAGSQTESYALRLRAADGKRLVGDFGDWLVAWPAAHRLTTLMNCSNWKDFEEAS